MALQEGCANRMDERAGATRLRVRRLGGQYSYFLSFNKATSYAANAASHV